MRKHVASSEIFEQKKEEKSKEKEVVKDTTNEKKIKKVKTKKN